jgi:SagB-type dehydrogenase family enzyme
MNMLDYHRISTLPVQPFRANDIQDPATWPDSWSTTETKLTARLDTIALRTAELSGDLSTCLATRASQRGGGDRRWDVSALGTLLGHAVGPRDKSHVDSPERRAYPSAGARFPVELYVVVDGLSSAANVFHYAAREHELHGVTRLRDVRTSVNAAFGPGWVAEAFGVVVLTAVLGRSARKYEERAYRYVLLESGHLAQNLLLTAEALGVGITPVGGFADRVVTAMIRADGRQEVVTYAVALT